MPLTAIEIPGPEWFTPTGLAQGEDPPQFKLRGLYGDEQADVAPELTVTEAGDLELTSSGIRILLAAALLDWRNVVDAAGAAIELPAGGRARQRLLPYPVQTAIAARVFELTYLAPEDKKKS